MKKGTPKNWGRFQLPLSLIAFAIFAFALLMLCYSTYMRRIDAFTLFMSTKAFYQSCMALPGGLLSWAGTFLTQFMHVPWLGALLLCIAYAIAQYAYARAFRFSARFSAATLVLPALMLLSLLNLGYLIFTLKPMGYAFMLPLGVISAILLYWASSLLKAWWLKALACAAIVIAGYPLFGFYALLAAAMVAVSTLLHKGTPLWQRAALAGIGIAAIVAFPRLWFVYAGGNLMESQIYISGLPRFYSYEIGMRALYASIFCLLLLSAVLAPWFREKTIKQGSAAAWGIGILAMLAVIAGRYDDRNFSTTLELQQAIWDQDWQKALAIAENMPEQPTRLNTALAYIPMIRMGVAGDMLFSIPYGWEPYNSTRAAGAFHSAGAALLSYHLGLINYANRWGMEYSIEQGMSAERLKTLVKCALLNFETSLAETYLDLLYNTIYHRDWAKRYQRYVKDPMLIYNDPEMGAIKQLMCHPNRFINDGGAVEGYIWPLIAQAGEGTPQFNELSMQAALINRDLESMMTKLPAYASTHQRIPRYYQEAAAYWARMHNTTPPIAIDEAIQRRFQLFTAAFHNSTDVEAEDQRERLRGEFADTFWFYFIFTEDNPIL